MLHVKHFIRIIIMFNLSRNIDNFKKLLRDRIFFNNPFQNSLEICILSSTISISLACIPSLLVTDIPFLKFDTCCLLRVHSNIVNNKRFLNDSSGICKTLAFKYCFSNYISMY